MESDLWWQGGDSKDWWKRGHGGMEEEVGSGHAALQYIHMCGESHMCILAR